MGIERLQHIPLYIDRIVGKPSPAELKKHQQWIRDALERGERYGMVLDMRKSVPGSFQENKANAAFMRENRVEIQKLCFGCAIVVKTSMVRLALNTILIFQPLPMTSMTTENMEEAFDWILTRFEEEGIPFPESAIEVLDEMVAEDPVSR